MKQRVRPTQDRLSLTCLSVSCLSLTYTSPWAVFLTPVSVLSVSLSNSNRSCRWSETALLCRMSPCGLKVSQPVSLWPVFICSSAMLHHGKCRLRDVKMNFPPPSVFFCSSNDEGTAELGHLPLRQPSSVPARVQTSSIWTVACQERLYQ